MTALRRAGSMTLVALGALALALGAVMIWIDGHVFDTDEVVDTTAEILETPSVRELVREQLTTRISAEVDPILAPIVADAVVVVIDDPRFTPLLSDAVGDAHRLLVEGDSERITFSLAAVWPVVVAELDAIDPTISPLLPDVAASLDFTLTERSELPAVWSFVDRFHRAALALVAFGLALVGLALVIGPSRWALIVVVGVGLVVTGLGVQLAAGAARQEIEDRTSGAAEEVAVAANDLFVAPLDDRMTQLAVVGGVVILIGIAVRLLRPMVRRPGSPGGPPVVHDPYAPSAFPPDPDLYR